MDSLLALIGLDIPAATFSFAVALVAGIVRGFAGFGMSAIIVLALALILPPAQVVPMVMVMEVMASLRMLPGVRREMNWKLAGYLLAGSAVGTPIGAYLLGHVPASVMRAGLSVFVLGMSLLLWRGFRLPGRPKPAWGLGVGLFSGTANGAASFGGQPNALFLLSTSVSTVTARATLVLIALFTDIYGTTVYQLNGLLNAEIIWRATLLLLPMAAGIMIGERYFRASKPESYRRFALVLLMTLAIAGLLRTAIG